MDWTKPLVVSVCCTLLLPSTALASDDDAPRPLPLVYEREAAPLDEVRLKSGGFYKGTITELAPDDHVVILPVGKDDPVRVEWSDVDEVVRASSAGSDSSANDAPSPQGSSGGPIVTVKLDGKRTTKTAVVLKKITGGATVRSGGYIGTAEYYEDICNAPCDVRLPAESGQYTVEAAGYGQPAAFTLSGDAERHVVSYRPGNRGLSIGGLALMFVGGMTGAALLGLGGFVDEPGKSTTLYTAGTIVLVGGLAGGFTMRRFGRPKATVDSEG